MKRKTALASSASLDAHALLQRVYQDEKAEMHMRLDAAKAAIRFEKPALASIEQKVESTIRNVVRLPEIASSVDEWKASVLRGKH
jgi:hypothetical protein